jgi:hypothetical protein
MPKLPIALSHRNVAFGKKADQPLAALTEHHFQEDKGDIEYTSICWV